MTGLALDLTDTFKRAVSTYSAGRLADAEQLCRQILSVQPDHFDATHVLAIAQAGLGKNDLALTSYDRALSLRPDHADVLNNRGGTLLALNRVEEALRSYDRALAVRPDYAEAFSSRASALERLNRLDEALASCDRALATRPDFVDALYNRGNILRALGRHADAMTSYDRVIALRPGHADAHNNRGQALRELMRYDEALASYDAALAVQPRHVMAHCNAAALRLLTGDFQRGWAHFEWRWKKASFAAANRNFAQPLWLGEPAIADRTVLIHSEQGLGDTIQFCRYVPLVAAQGARLIFEVQEPLLALMSSLAGGAQVVARGTPLPAFDVHCPLLSLPLAFGTAPETIPSAPAYLRASPQQSAKWRARLGARRRPLVGLVWSGNPRHERDRERSIPLRGLLPLLEAGGSFVSLQKEVRPEDLAVLKQRGEILHAGDDLGDFADSAALVAELDLVVSVDTSVAHLAGALGKPVWILLTHVPDWRWLLGRDDSPWYPTARLYRQDRPGAWNGAIERVRDALSAFVAGARA